MKREEERGGCGKRLRQGGDVAGKVAGREID